jgi:hypothetical protein
MTIAWMATGLLASTTLAGCAKPDIRPETHVVAMPVKDTPPADLLICPELAKPFPTDATATIPENVRAPLKGLALGYRDLFDRTRRLINWIAPGSCPAPAPAK